MIKTIYLQPWLWLPSPALSASLHVAPGQLPGRSRSSEELLLLPPLLLHLPATTPSCEAGGERPNQQHTPTAQNTPQQPAISRHQQSTHVATAGVSGKDAMLTNSTLAIFFTHSLQKCPSTALPGTYMAINRLMQVL